MARLRPFHALHPLNRDPARARAEKPAFYALEIEPAAPERPYRPPVRVLLGVLDPGEEAPSIEDGLEANRLLAPGPAAALVPDDHHVFRKLLADAVGGLSPVLASDASGRDVRLFELDPGQVKRLTATLTEVLLRPLAPLATGAPTLVALYPMSDPGLRLRPVHRAIKNVPNFDASRFLTLVREYARIIELDAPIDTPSGLAQAQERLATLSNGYHAVLLVLPGGRGTILRFRQALELDHVRAAPRNPTLRSLDLALLNALVLRTVIGLEQPERIGHPQVFTVDDLPSLVEQVQAGTFQAGFALNPPPLWEVRAVIAASQQLPPRTLRIDPSPGDALSFDPERP